MQTRLSFPIFNMKIIKNSILPIGENFGAINLFGILFIKKDMKVSNKVLNHEKIHSAQMKELIYIPFYFLYVVEWLIRLIIHRGNSYKAYLNISFEKEAYENEKNESYLSTRKKFAQWRKTRN